MKISTLMYVNRTYLVLRGIKDNLNLWSIHLIADKLAVYSFYNIISR